MIAMLKRYALRHRPIVASIGRQCHCPRHRTISHFRVVEHTVKCQHTRDRPAGAELSRENELRLHVKQYIPKTNEKPKPGDVTLIGAHANGFPKELYEPFWDELYEGMEARGKRIRGVWIADLASQGRSGVLNQELIGPDASWFDHGRDLLFFINQFQEVTPHPIIGIGHSVGGSQLADLALLHPRLLHSLILIDPILQTDLSLHHIFARLSTTRRDRWSSRQAAAEAFKASKFYAEWDPRVLEQWIEYGLRDIPSSNNEESPPVTLTTTVAQEVYFYLQAAYNDPRLLRGPNEMTDGDIEGSFFARPEMHHLVNRLPELKPSTMYIFGSTSPASTPAEREAKLKATGTGIGGSGGTQQDRVEEALLDCGHLIPFEQPKECAEVSADFLERELGRWEKEENRKRKVWEAMTRDERVGINELWKDKLGVKSKEK